MASRTTSRVPRSDAARPALLGVRKSDDRVLGGVAAGIAAQLHLDPIVVRVGFVIAAFAGGAGIVLYLVGWWLIPDRDPAAPAGVATVTPGPLRLEPGGGLEQAIAVGCIVVGLLLLMRRVGLWFSDALVWPIALAGIGAVVLWSRTGAEDRARLTAMAAKIPGRPFETLVGRVSLARVAFGAALILAGIGAFLASNATAVAARQVAIGMVVTVTGVGLLVGPWIARLTRELRAERRERIRSEERSEMAAHLHDSVLQTLALIQRNADRPRETVALARRQERELHAWLYDEQRGHAGDATTLAEAIRAQAAEVEARHDVDVDVVVVGDHPLDPHVEALVAATREAMVNAAKHSGAPVIAVFVEVDDTGIRAAVRDRGKGFEVDIVPDDRKGIAQSIRQRMHRHGGTVAITSIPGEGTEVEMELPRAS